MQLLFICHQITFEEIDMIFLVLQRLLAKLSNKEKEAFKLAEHLDFEKVYNTKQQILQFE